MVFNTRFYVPKKYQPSPEIPSELDSITAQMRVSKLRAQ